MPTFQNSGQNSSAGVDTLDLTITISSESNRFLLATACAKFTSSVHTSATLDPGGGDEQTMTQVSELTQGNCVWVWYELAAPVSGASKTLRFALSASRNLSIGAAEYSDVDQTTPRGTLFTAQAGDVPVTVDVTDGEDGDLVVDQMGAVTGRTPSADPSQTVRVVETEGGPDPNTGISEQASSASAVTMSWDFSGGGAFNSVLGAANLNAAAAGSGQTVEATLQETFTFVDQLGDNARIVDRVLTEAFSYADSPARDLDLTRALEDAFSLTDDISRDAIFDRLLSDAFSLTDQLNRDQDLDRTLSDALSLTDQITRDLDLVRELQDAFSLTENLDSSVSGGGDTIEATLQETLALVDELISERDLTRVLSDAFSFTESLVREGVFDRTLSESLSLAENLARDVVLTRTASDVLALTDDLTRVRELSRALSDAFALSESLDRSLDLTREPQDTLALVDNLDITTTGATPVTSFVHWRLLRYHKWALRRRLWRRYMDLDTYPPQ